MRLLIVGMGGHLGTAVAQRFDRDPSVEMLGIDIEPPRRLLRRAQFSLVVDPTMARAAHDIARRIADFSPTHVAHFGVYEPHARANPRVAHVRSMAMTKALCDGLAEVPRVKAVVFRSGIEVYGRQRGTALSPDELVEPVPTSGFGRTLWELEQVMADLGRARGISVARLRFAPVAGPHTPSPLTRYLRLPLVVPVGAIPDPPFSLLHIDDAAAATVAAVERRFDGAVNVVGAGAVTASQAVRLGGRIPVPTVGPGWLLARLAAASLGSPLPEHVIELFTRGRTADGALARSALGFVSQHSTIDIVRDMYHWSPVTYLEVDTVHAA